MTEKRPTLGLSLFLALAGCAHAIPAPPTPLALDLPPPVTGTPAPAMHEVAVRLDRLATYSWTPSPPLLPLPDPRVVWWPRAPRQAAALAISVGQPGGPPLEAVTVSLAGRPVSLTRGSGGWIGLGALPLDSAGLFELDLSYRRRGAAETRKVLVSVAERTYPSSRIRISAGAPANPEVEARIAREREVIRSTLAASAPEWIPTEPFGWPRQPPVKTSPFGQRRVFNGAVQSRHLGLDLRARQGNPIVAPAAGRVALTGDFYYQGNAVYLDHGLGLVTAYFHLSSVAVRTGDLVRPGQLLGRAGSTGRSTAPHLHWSAYVRGTTVDPETLVGLDISGVRPPATSDTP